MPNDHVKVWVKRQAYCPDEYLRWELVDLGPPLVLRNKENGHFAGRFPELSLTGYGDTSEEARSKVKKMFWSMVQTLRETGGKDYLERWLQKHDMRWEWSEESEDVVYEE